MPIVNKTHIVPAVYTQKTSAIRSSGAALMLDNSALDAVDDEYRCKIEYGRIKWS